MYRTELAHSVHGARELLSSLSRLPAPTVPQLWNTPNGGMLGLCRHNLPFGHPALSQFFGHIGRLEDTEPLV